MGIFFIILGYVLLLVISTFLIIFMCEAIKIIRIHRIEIDNIEKNLYLQLREIQFKAKNIGKFAQKLAKQKNSFLSEMFSNLLIAMLPFKKLRAILLIKRLLKNLS